MVQLIRVSFLALLSLMLLPAAPALADQCAYVSKDLAIQAADELKTAVTVHRLCEPCGEKLAKELTPTSVVAKHTGYEDYWQVFVNGKGIDLAYTFLDRINLSKFVGCPATDISEFLSAEHLGG